MALRISRRSFGWRLAAVALAGGHAATGVGNSKDAHLSNSKDAAGPRKTISLDGKGWQLLGMRPGEGEKLGLQTRLPQSLSPRPACVPNDVQLAAGIEDPYGQEPQLADINKQEWWYLRSFSSPAITPNQRVRLHLVGVDYFADVWLNGKKLGSHEGAYTQFHFDVTHLLAPASLNYLAVRVSAPWRVAGRSHFEYMKGEFDSAWDALPGPGQVVFPLGIHRSVRLEIAGPVRIEQLRISTVKIQKGHADLKASIMVSNAGAVGSMRMELSISPENFPGPPLDVPAQTITFSGIQHELKETQLAIRVPEASLWWTWDQGPQNLYKAEARLVDDEGQLLDSFSANFGIRTLERDSKLQYKINGRPLLLRGAWYPMSKLYPAETDWWTYEKDMLLARHANMNHLLNYTVVEKSPFYELADRLGILLFIELPFNQEGPLDALNKSYPRRAEYIEWSARQVAEIVRDLSNHPSIGVWSALSEVTGNGYDFSTSPDPRIAAAADGYRVFSEKMEQTVLANDPDALYFEGYCDFGEHHFWEGSLVKGTTYDQQFHAKADFVSEYGALAYFPMESIRRTLDPKEVWNDRRQRWSALVLPVSLQRLSYLTGFCYQGLEFLVPEIADNVDPHPQSFQDLVNASQIYQSFLYGYAGDAYRRKLFNPIHGIRSWMFKNFTPKPVSGFGVIDSFNTPLMAYYSQRRTYAPVAMSFAVRYALESVPAGSRWKVPVWISNATNAGLFLSVECSLNSLDGARLREYTGKVSLPANQAWPVYDLDWELPETPGIYLLRGRAISREDVVASNEMYIKVAPRPTRKNLKVLVVGTGDWAEPVIDYLTNLGAEVAPVFHPSGSVLAEAGRFPESAEDLRRRYDVIWLTGFDSYWREAPEAWTPIILKAVEAGVAFAHSGSWSSFHGGDDDQTAALDLTPLAQVLPVAVKHQNDVWDGEMPGFPSWSKASPTQSKVEVCPGAPEWLRQADFEGLYPSDYHILDPRSGATTVLSVSGHPLLVTGRYGRGRTVAYLGFSPRREASGRFVPDRAIRFSPESRLFAMIAIAVLALATGEKPEVSIRELIESRATPVFATLKSPAPAAWPEISLAWTDKAARSVKARVQIKNGPTYFRGLRLRFDGPDFADGSVLPLWTSQFFDLLPVEEATCNVELRAKTALPDRRISIIAESLNSSARKIYEIPPP